MGQASQGLGGEGGESPRAVQARGDSVPVPVPEAKPRSCAGSSSSLPFALRFCRGARVAGLVEPPHRNLQASSAGTSLHIQITVGVSAETALMSRDGSQWPAMARHGPSWPVMALSFSHHPLSINVTHCKQDTRIAWAGNGMHGCRGTESSREPMPLLPGQRHLTQARFWHLWHGHGHGMNMSMSTGKQLA